MLCERVSAEQEKAVLDFMKYVHKSVYMPKAYNIYVYKLFKCICVCVSICVAILK